jgi:hypothetical protein
MRMLVLAIVTAIGAAALTGPAIAQSVNPTIWQHPPVNCSEGYVWLPAYWDRVNIYHRGQCVTNQEYQHLYTHKHS